MAKKKIKSGKKRKKKNDPYEIIEEFFCVADPAHYRKYILSILRAAYSEGYWKKSHPGDMLIFQEQMVALIRAAHGFMSDKKNPQPKRARAILDDDALMNGINPASYAGLEKENEIWEFFPRYLTKKEFINPWLVFKKVLKYRNQGEWKSDLKIIVSYALSPYGKESALEYDYLSINIYLQKLVEAAHLIMIRTGKSIRDKIHASE